MKSILFLAAIFAVLIWFLSQGNVQYVAIAFVAVLALGIVLKVLKKMVFFTVGLLVILAITGFATAYVRGWIQI